MEINHDLRAWIARVGLSLGMALGAGVLAYLVARGITSALLLLRQQQLVREAAGALRGGVDGLAAGDLHAVRLAVQQIDTRNEQFSLVAGFVAAALVVVIGYLWLERRAART